MPRTFDLVTLPEAWHIQPARGAGAPFGWKVRRMRLRPATVIASLALVGATALVPAGAQPAAQTNPRDRVQETGSETWIVTLRPGVAPSKVAVPMASAQGGKVQHVFRAALTGFSFTGSAQAASTLERNPNVEQVTHAAEFRLQSDGVPNGILRIGGWQTLTGSPLQRGTTLGEPRVPVRVGILDSGIDTDHPELQPQSHTTSCAPGSPSVEDTIGHGTHVAGTIAARVNGTGITGLAPEVEIVPVKVVDDQTASGTDADLICGIDYIVALRQADGHPSVINMSLGDYGSVGATCADTPLRQAICNAVEQGVTVVAAAGNDARDIGASSFVPAAFPEVIAASAYVDGDGAAGGLAGCHFSLSLFMNVCDDTLAAFSNRGAPIDVTAPGVEIYSTVPGGYGSKSGTSMASPHVAAAAALVTAANPMLSPAQVRHVLRVTGECPDGTQADGGGSCAGHGTWPNDTDGVAEPLIAVPRATSLALAMLGPDTTPPTVSITSPPDGAAVSAPVTVTADANDNVGVASVEFFDGAGSLGRDATAPFSVSWTGSEGPHTLTAVARDAAGNGTTSGPVDLTVDRTAPSVSLTAPLAGPVSGATTVSASADDGAGTGVAQVEFRLDGVIVASDTTAPFETTWDTRTASNGAHDITAVARDAAGNAATSVAVPVVVGNGWSLSSSVQVATQITSGSGVNPVVGDFNGDGRSDVFFYAPGSSTDYLWISKPTDAQGSAADRFSVTTLPISGTYTPVVGDFDGNGATDIFWYAPGTNPDSIWYFADGTIAASVPYTITGSYAPVVADFDSSDTDDDTPQDDIFWYSSSGSTSLWSGTAARTFTAAATPSSRRRTPRSSWATGPATLASSMGRTTQTCSSTPPAPALTRSGAATARAPSPPRPRPSTAPTHRWSATSIWRGRCRRPGLPSRPG